MKSLALFSLLTALSFSSLALVDMRNGNFANTWVDLEVPGVGYDLRVVRTYNSKSLHDGIFGFGWCSDFESKVEVTAEGNLKYSECGSGQEVFYTPREFTSKEIEGTVQKIVAAVKKAKKVSDQELRVFIEDLRRDADLRTKFAQAYKISNSVREGTSYFANGREIENIILAKGVYTRTLSDGSFMRFSVDGRLTHMYDKNGNFVRINYEKSRVRDVEDNNGRKLSFRFTPGGKVLKITGPNNLSVDYKYSGLDDLASVRNSWGNTYSYDYDDAHNMVKAIYPDKTFIALSYDKKNDWVMSFSDREKCLENYKYESNPKNPLMHYWSTVRKTCGKEVTNESRHEFWYAKRNDGETFLQKVQSTVNGSVTEVVYHSTFGKPVSLRRNQETYDYDYYPNGQVKTKTTRLGTMAYKYDSSSRKVSEVTSETKNAEGKVIATRKSEFKYDNKGNLTFARNSDGVLVNMTYDTRGRIATITDQAKKVVQIKYEERFGKPSIVTRPGLGTIQVSYKANGDIDKVNSPEGPTVAMQVASTFNNLLDVIAPATAEIFSN